MDRPAGRRGGRPPRKGGPFRPCGAKLPEALVGKVEEVVKLVSSNRQDVTATARMLHRCLEWGLQHERCGAPLPPLIYSSYIESEAKHVSCPLSQEITDAVVAPYEAGDSTLTDRLIELLHRGLAYKGHLDNDDYDIAPVLQLPLGLELSPTGT